MIDGTSHPGAVHTTNSQSSEYSASGRAGTGGTAVAMRTIPRPKTIGTCLTAAALLLGFTAPARAQQIVEFVSNTGVSTLNDGIYQLRDEDSAAQAFYTGSNRTGYDLDSIVVDLDEFPASGDFAFTVKLWSSTLDRKPESVLCTLDNPATLGTGEQTFTNDNCPTLKATTWYFVVMRFELTGTGIISDLPEWKFTPSGNEDSAAAAGWSIGDEYYYRVGDGAAWVKGGASFKIKVKGAYTNKDREALVALYNATGGPENEWRNDSNWDSNASLDMWNGVNTDIDGRVTELNLSQNTMSGSIPAELGDLTYLQKLDLGFNDDLTGSIPADLGDLTNLQYLSLSSNKLTGSIPTELGNLTKLTSLSLSKNNLTGSIPADLGRLTSLKTLLLHSNELTGSIPAALGDLTSLTTLNLFNNELTGSIPADLGRLTSLKTLALHTNDLSASIPAALSGLSNLTSLYLYSNKLTGSIPAALSGLASLTELELGSNQLTGSIPAALGGLSNLTNLALNSNQLTGSIPTELSGLSNLTNLALNSNRLTGSIPTALGGLTDLEGLYLDNNLLTGSIPTAFRNLTNLLYLYVDNGLCVPAHTAFQQWFGDLDEFRGDSTNICPPPTASGRTVSTDEDTAYTFDADQFGFSGGDGDTLDHVKITALPGTDRGTLSFNGTDITDLNTAPQVTFSATDEFRYTPLADGNGNAFAKFDFKVNDGGLDSATSYTITVDVSAVQDAPVATTDTAETSPGTAIIIGVLENDLDVDGDTLRVSAVGTPTAPNNGTATINVNATTVTYTPDATFTAGTDTFDYTVTDEHVAVTTSVTVTIIPANQNANLSNLTISSGTLTRDFAATTTSYVVEVEAATASLKVTPTTAEVDAKVTVNDRLVASGSASYAIPLALGAASPIRVEVTAADGTTIQTYTITVHRAADRTAPMVAITSEAAAPLTEAFTLTITFSEAVTGFEGSDIQVTNGTVTDFSGSEMSYGAEITPSASGEVRVEVGAGVAEDRAGNGNEAAEPFIIEADLKGPQVEITAAATGPVWGAVEVTITFSAAVTGFEGSDIQVTNGTVTDFSGSGTSYTAEITPSASGEVRVEVGADVAEDRAGNGNEAAEPFIIEADLKGPQVEITSDATGPVWGAVEVTITFSAAVTGFEGSDIQVTDGTVTDFSGSGTSYTAEITPSASGEVRVEVGADVAEDAAGNGNAAAAPFVIATGIAVSYQEESYTAREGGETVTVRVKLSQGWDEELAIPIRVTRPETTEVGDYQIEGLEDWDAEAGTGTLTFGAGRTEQTFTIAANHDGDGDDETVELGFGELPEIVIAGEPAVAIVTLEDKGLVELDVRFGQAAYEVKEGEAAEIKLTVSPAADRRVEVPLEVAFQGGAMSEDYRGVPVSVVFESGESEGTISVEVLADEVNDPEEGIVLSLGALPEAVSAGDPASTEVHFGQRRTAEQFTSSLEAMLAVMGRSMGESAQTAIGGRFERHRQWSRLGSSGGAVSTSQPGRANRAAALGAGESERGGSEGSGGRGAAGSGVQRTWGVARTSAAPGPDWNSEHREPGTPVSWLRNVVLGSFGNLARAAQSDSAMSTGYGRAPGRSIPGQDRRDGSGFGDARLGPGSGEFTGMQDQALNFSGASLEMSLGEREGETSWVPVLWGQGDLQRFNGDLTRLGMDYGGGLEAAHVGLDLYANDRVLAGLSFMRSWGDLEYSDDGVAGVLESRMNTAHPYLYLQPHERLSVWGIGGLGQGQVAVEEPGRTHEVGAEFRMFVGGVRAVLSGRGSNEWGLRADAFTTQLGTDALADIAAVRGEAQRGRLMLDWVHERALSAGRSLSVQVEAGRRIDQGDADRGAGMETGFRLGYLDANSGLDVALHGRVLVVHESDYRDWGAGVQASWDPGQKQRGFRASVNSALGQDGGGRTTLWDSADAVMRPAGMGAMGIGSQYRMESEVAYAGLKAPGLPGLLTPYGRLRRAGQGRELAFGTAWSLPTRSQLALPATLELETIRRETSTGPAYLAVLAQMSIPF